jgi:ribulose-phosphate 3-epimerase
MSWRDWVRGVEVVPSIYAADFKQLGPQLTALLDAGARIFHFDVGDGHFVEEITMGPAVLQAIAPLVHERGGVIACHLMVTDPARQFAQLASAGADSVTFHVEACGGDVAAVVERARSLGLRVGVAFNPETPVERAAIASAHADVALCMSIHPGLSGQSFMPEAYERIRQLRRLRPDGLIQVDGGVHDANIAEVARAGADLLVAGSAIFWAGDPAGAYRRLRGLAQVAREHAAEPAARPM